MRNSELLDYALDAANMTMATQDTNRLENRTNPQQPLVLIVDDDETARDLYGHWFIAQGFQVMCAVGVEGLSFALRRDRPQLIVTELHARDLSVSHLLTRLRSDETTRCIPVLIVTSSSDDRALEEARTAGALAVFRKLTDFDRLGIWVRVLCG